MGRALLPGAGFLEAGIAGAITALPVDVASAADVALLDCTVPVPLILPDPSAASNKGSLPTVKGGSRGEGKSSSRSTAAAASKFVGMEWCVENGSPNLEIASLSSHPLTARPRAGEKRSTPAHFRARLSLISQRDITRSMSRADGGDGVAESSGGGGSGGGGLVSSSSTSSSLSQGDAVVEGSTITAENDAWCARHNRRRDVALLLFASTTVGWCKLISFDP